MEYIYSKHPVKYYRLKDDTALKTVSFIKPKGECVLLTDEEIKQYNHRTREDRWRQQIPMEEAGPLEEDYETYWYTRKELLDNIRSDEYRINKYYAYGLITQEEYDEAKEEIKEMITAIFNNKLINESSIHFPKLNSRVQTI